MPRVLLVMSPEGYARGLISGFNSYALTRGWSIHLVAPSSYADHPLGDVLKGINGLKADALVVTRNWWERLIPHLGRQRIIVGAEVDLSGSGLPSVVVDNDAAGREAAQYLLQKGLRSFAAYGISTDVFAVERAVAFRRMIEEAGCRFTGWDSSDATLASSSGQWIHGVREWLDSIPKPAGVLACCDHWGKQLIESCAELGVRIPKEVAVVGVDNEEIITALSRPPLSSVSIPWPRLGQEAARLVDAALRGERPLVQPVRIGPGSVAERASTDVETAADRDVGLALMLIRKSAGRPIGVPDLLEQIPVSRRRLEQRFRQVTGRTLLDAIRQAHVDQAKRLLETTAMTTAQVAEESGFSGASRLSIAFRRHTGLTPSEYRRRFQLQHRRGGTES